MSLNQTQRDHAIKMVTERIHAKKQTIEIPFMSPNAFAQKWLSSQNKKSISVNALFPITKKTHESRSWNGSVVRPSFNSFYPTTLFAGLEADWNLHCDMHALENEKRTADLVKLKEKLIGEIMFGKDYSVIEAAFAAIDSL